MGRLRSGAIWGLSVSSRLESWDVESMLDLGVVVEVVVEREVDLEDRWKIPILTILLQRSCEVLQAQNWEMSEVEATQGYITS